MRTLHWFRNDLRLQDNPALLAACQQGEVLPVFILDTDEPVRSVLGGASRAWLHQSLTALDASLNNNLVMLKGSAQTLIPDLCARYQIEAVTWNRGYEPWTIQRDSGLKTALKANGLSVTSYNGALLFEPWDTVKKDGYPYRVYTPFYKHCMANLATRTPGVLNTARIQVVPHGEQAGLESLALRPKVAWDEAMLMDWTPGEQGAQGRLQHFLATGMGDYREGRDFPAKRSVSGLSAHLHFGEISPHQILASVRAESPADDNQTHFIKELVWREFSYNLLYHFPTLQEKNLQAKFDHFPWETDETFLKAWQTGQTGYPIVDAGMRELRQTGSMHNRVRMIVASFLIKNLK
ncbi:MAG: deoxyribodipyrimidine photo-lyase, partial [Gammaproteobacteria bacterium]|nr:deoxyribodipyrimidine photo-lyase [Gammaproteobacteria bacterium]